MASCILRSLARSAIGVNERIALLSPAAVAVSWRGNLISTSATVSSHLKAGSVFDQARAFSEKSNTKKSSKNYVSDSDSDSDSDNEKRSKKDAYTSEFWRQKMRTMHAIFDINNDGVISYDDFMILSEKFSDLGHLKPQELEEFKNVLKSTWESNFGEVTPYNTVTIEEYLTEMHHVMTDKSLKKKVHKFLPFLFQAVDKDNSGEISIDEFRLFFKCLGLTEKDAETSFKAIDKNGDGMLSIKEFVKLGRDFFLTENPKRVSRSFWGPLAPSH